MKNKFLKFMASLLVAVMVLSAAPLNGFVGLDLPDLFSLSAFAATSGKCGSNATWSFDEATGVLTIDGTGDMSDYKGDSAASYYVRPWKDYKDAITSVVIGDGITSIGSYAFRSCKNLTSVTIGSGVTTIGSCAFTYCTKLESIVIPDSVTIIRTSAFAECSKLVTVELLFALLIRQHIKDIYMTLKQVYITVEADITHQNGADSLVWMLQQL